MKGWAQATKPGVIAAVCAALVLGAWSGCGKSTGDEDSGNGGGVTGEPDDVIQTGGSVEVVNPKDILLAEDGTSGPETSAIEEVEDPEPLGCPLYCATVEAECAGDNRQYTDELPCLEWCQEVAVLPVGALDDDSGNTVGCRLHYAALAAQSVAAATAICDAAGPFGDDTCGGWCDNYCHLAPLVCDFPEPLFEDTEACLTACKEFRQDGVAGELAGNSVQCRLTHLFKAATDPPASASEHCPFADVDGGEQCVDPPPTPTCTAYCEITAAACTGDNAQYTDKGDCVEYCETWAALPEGTPGDDFGNSIACRTTWAALAEQSPAEAGAWCANAGPTGNDTCGTWCESYCHLAMLNCTGDQALYPSDAACLDVCAGYDDSGAPGASDGDTVQCRLYQVGQAGDPDGAGAEAHCPNGGPAGGEVCVVPPPPPPTCAEYCDAIASACTGANAQFASDAACGDYCAGSAWAPGTPGDVSGNTLSCRLSQAEAAALDPDLCAAAGPTGGGLCGTLCESYCPAAAALCPTIFATDAECAQACAGWEDGEYGTPEGDTKHCRLQVLALALTDDTVCAEAGPDSDTCVWPPSCDAYCAAVTAACSGADAQYDSADDCLAFCGASGAGVPLGTLKDITGNTVGCRLHHSAAPTVVCASAGPTGGGVCGSSCDAFCHLASAGCGLYAGAEPETCPTDCNALPAGAPGDAAGDSVQCRLTYLVEAATAKGSGDDPTAACAAGGLNGGGICVVPTPTCADYCAAMGELCPNEPAWDDEAGCLAFCQGWPGLPPGDFGETAGSTLGCRLNQAEQGDCAAAGPTGGGVCGTWCEVFCDLGAVLCGGGDFPAADACPEQCALIPSAGQVGDTSGDSIQCLLQALTGPGGPDCAAETCVAPGDTCVEPTLVSALPYQVTSDTTGYTDTLTVEAGACGLPVPLGAGAPDHVYQLTPEAPLIAHVTVAGDASFDPILVVATDCGAPGESCVAAGATDGDEALLMAFPAGVSHTLFVDGASAGAAGAYTLTITECAPQCADKSCGDDQCLGSCGECDAGQTCHEGQCLDGDGCASPILVDGLPYGDSQDTGDGGFSDTYSASDLCADGGSQGEGTPDVVYAFTPSFDGLFEITVETDKGGSVTLTNTPACAPTTASCSVESFLGTEAWSVTVPLEEGSTSYIVVDPAVPGGYSIDIEDVTPPWECEDLCALVHDLCIGDDTQYVDEGHCTTYCEEAAALPPGHHLDLTENSVSCRYNYGVTLAAEPTTGLVNCPIVGQSGGGVCGTWCQNYCHLTQKNCVGADALYPDVGACEAACAAFPTTGLANAPSGDTVQCRTYHAGNAGEPELNAADVSTLCGAASPGGSFVCIDLPTAGDVCAEAETIELLPFVGANTTLGATDDYAYPSDACPGDPAGSGQNAPDRAWRLAPETTAEYRLVYSPVEYDGALYVVEKCGDIASTCHAASNNPGVSADEEIVTVLQAGQPRFVIVDGDDLLSGGDLQLTVSVHSLTPTCGTYCSLIADHCLDDAAQFAGVGDCLSWCDDVGKPVKGTFEDTDVPTLGCRTMAALSGECDAAGPGGGGVCGTWCDAYCQVVASACVGENLLYATTESCLASCADFPDEAEAGATVGDSVQCRMTHALLAATDGGLGATYECASASASSNGICGGEPPPTCESTCESVQQACVGGNQQYESQAACQQICEAVGFDPGFNSDTSSNTLGCRTSYAKVIAEAGGNPNVLCAKAGPSGGGTCGEWCEVYCQLGAFQCSAAHPAFATAESCQLACGQLPTDGKVGDSEGDSVQCRIGYLLAALAGNVQGCLEGAPDSASQCVVPPPPGNTCQEAILVLGLPYSHTGTTVAATDEYAFDETAPGAICGDTQGGAGGGDAGEVVYALTAAGDGPLRLHLSGDYDPLLWVATDCDATTSSCLAASDAVGATVAEVIDLPAAGGETYYIMVDGSAGGAGAGEHTLTITPLAAECTNYCATVNAACATPESVQYADFADCATYCLLHGALPAGAPGDEGVNTIGCRVLEAARAMEGDLTHCAAAGRTGGGVCGSWCDSYCHLTQLHCQGGEELYPDEATCLAACAELDDGGTPGDAAGDTVQCRLHHLGLPDAGAAECAAASVAGGGVCGPPEGEACKLPFTVGALPFTTTASTSGGAADLSLPADACGLPAGAPETESAADHVYRYEAAADAGVTLRITLSPTFDAVLYAVRECGDPTGTCAASAVVAAGAGLNRIVTLETGASVHVIVDGADGASGEYTLTIEVAIPTCSEYCATSAAGCPGNYPSEAACLAHCDLLPAGPLTAGVNTVGCRTLFAQTALIDPTTAEQSCPRAAALGGGECGTVCDAYCAYAMGACASDPPFESVEACLLACGAYPTSDDDSSLQGDSRQCRVNHALAAVVAPPDELDAQCAAASADGGDACVAPPTCEEYCALVNAACTAADAQYDSEEECTTYCATVGAFPPGQNADQTGNSVACRAYHAELAQAAPGDAAEHCPRAGPTGAGICGTWCEAYCALGATHCGLGPDLDTCLADCAPLPDDGEIGDVAGNTVQCRIHHAAAAGDGALGGGIGLHCPAASLDGGGICSDVAAPLGDACAEPFVVTESGVALVGGTNSAINHYAVGAGSACGQTLGGISGQASGDQVYAVTAVLDGTLDVTLIGQEFESVLYVMTDCSAPSKSCVAADDLPGLDVPESVGVETVAGTTYYIVVDGVGGAPQTGGYVLVVGGTGFGAASCNEYCSAVGQACVGAAAQYTDELACLDYCLSYGQIPLGDVGAIGGDTVGCRHTQALAAADAAPDEVAPLCAAAGVTGADVCGTWCENYCRLASLTCVGPQALFDSPEECAAACAALPDSGAAADLDGDSVQCRIRHLGLAMDPSAQGPAHHCAAASPLGGGVCGELPPSCEDYCATVTGACVGADAQYADEAACLASCTDAEPWPLGATSESSGNTLGCRQGQAQAAATLPPEQRADACAAAGPSGGGVCGTWCESYCSLALLHCDEHADAAACQQACAALPTGGAPGAVIGDSVQCRISWALAAGTAAPVAVPAACAAAATADSTECVPAPTCGEYCGVVVDACASFGAPYADEGACAQFCGPDAALPAGKHVDVSGNTVGCRLSHATDAVAAADAGDTDLAGVECAAAGRSGGDTCGTWCESYCHLALTRCSLYADAAECESACATLGADGVDGDLAGDTVQCRIAHLTLPTVGCAAAAPDGGGVCVPPLPTCADYCGAVVDGCGGDLAHFGSEGACLQWCAAAQLPPGTFQDVGGNTLGCRYGASLAAAANPDEAAAQCAAASPSGGDTCGTWCQSYCHLAALSCPLYASDDDCQAACAAFPADGKAGDQGGDTVQCRIALLDPAAPDCAAASPDGGGVCVPAPTCQAYCAQVTAACAGADAQYPDQAACEAYCATQAALVEGVAADTSTNSVSCRAHYAALAATEPDQASDHCAAAGPSGADTCGSWCDNLCHLALTNCPTQHADLASCLSACGAVPDTGQYGDGTGDTVQCRLLHLGLAGGAADATASCAAGAIDGNGTCRKLGEQEIDLGGWKLSQTGGASFSFPPGTIGAAGTFLVVGRNAEKAAFAAYWEVNFDPVVQYFDGGGAFPQINGGEQFTLTRPDGSDADGPTFGIAAGTDNTRNEPPTDPADAGSWATQTALPSAAPAPGGGKAGGHEAGAYLSEIADPLTPGKDSFEFVEVFVDLAGGAATATTYADVQGVFLAHCGQCHAGAQGQLTGCIGGPCFATSFFASQDFANYDACMAVGLSVGQCAALRISELSMPQDCPGCVPQADALLIDKWIEDGMLE